MMLKRAEGCVVWGWGRSQAGKRPGTREALSRNLEKLWKVMGKKMDGEKQMERCLGDG